METFILHVETKEQSTAIKAIAKALKIDLKKEGKLSEREKSINFYGKEFVEMVEQGKDDVKNGKTTRVEKENLKTFLGL
ncbi:MAG: hypothetical protein K2Q03_00970 [Sphingobacteriaceae bacterium]|nr:hypothetical protein [Sphingobacteriaceae bacterium]